MDRDTRILDRNGLTEAAYLQSYDPGRYERPSVAADVSAAALAGCMVMDFKRGRRQPRDTKGIFKKIM